MASGIVVTIGREYGSGGRIIARCLADRLGFSFYDRELIGLAAEKSGLSPEFIRESEGKKPSSFLYSLSLSSHNLPVNDQVFIAQSHVIKEVAETGNCVIVGRCADYVLRDHPGLISAFVHAPFEDRVRRAIEDYGVTPDEAQAQVLRTDKNRASYYNHFTTYKWGRCQNYHIAINSNIGLNLAIDLLIELVHSKEAQS